MGKVRSFKDTRESLYTASRKQHRERSAIENAGSAIQCSPRLADFLPSMLLSCSPSTQWTRTLATPCTGPRFRVQLRSQLAGWYRMLSRTFLRCEEGVTTSPLLRYTVLPLSYSISRTHSLTVPQHIFFKNQHSPLRKECVQIRLASWFIIFALVYICALPAGRGR